ncbi:MAG: tetratricopeptide repeat protein, partial [Bacteroidales bacterium]|nr:tetratricopeptide repeat protein [Bacteroidales bacterium]
MKQDYYCKMIINKLTKHVLLFISLFITTISFAQVQIQKGVSYRYNGKNPRTPLPNVVIKYDPERQPAISDSTGSFELTFSNRKMGDRIGLVAVTKREMMVFNQHAVDEWSIRKEPLCLVLCDADEFDRQKQEYIELGRKDAKRKYDQQKEELEKQLEEGKIKQDDLENALNVAYERLEKLQKEIDKYADDLARIDMSELDDKMQEILEMYQCGETEEAIERLKSLKLAEEFDKETAHNEAVQQELQQSDSKLYTLVEQMKSSVALLKNSGEWEEAGKYLKRIADKVNTFDVLYEYALFCQSQNNHQEAINYYNRALHLIDNETDMNSIECQNNRAALLNNLANLYKDTQCLAESEAMYNEALEIYRRLVQVNPRAYEPGMAMILHNLAFLYHNTQRLAESEAMYNEALEIYRSLAQGNPQAYESDVAMTLNNLANLYKDTQRLAETEAMYNEALEIYRRLAQVNLQAYEPELAMTLNNLASLYKDTQRLAESEAMYLEALEIYRRLVQVNPRAYEPGMAMILHNLAFLYHNTQRLAE